MMVNNGTENELHAVITANYTYTTVDICFRILFPYSFVPPQSVHNDFRRKSEPAKPREGGKEAQKIAGV